jgi:hypothetical protein
VTQTARPTVNADDDLASMEAECVGNVWRDDVRYPLNLEIVVPRAQRTHFVPLPPARLSRDLRRNGMRCAPFQAAVDR